MSAGGYQTCVRAANSNVACFGLDTYGMVGNNSTATTSVTFGSTFTLTVNAS